MIQLQWFRQEPVIPEFLSPESRAGLFLIPRSMLFLHHIKTDTSRILLLGTFYVCDTTTVISARRDTT